MTAGQGEAAPENLEARTGPRGALKGVWLCAPLQPRPLCPALPRLTEEPGPHSPLEWGPGPRHTCSG